MSGPTGVAPDGSPVALYRKLPGDAEAAFIKSLIGERAPVLELGAGAGRITRHLASARHAATAVDNGADMLACLRDIDGVETVLSDIESLNLSPRRWPVVLLASHLINIAAGPELLAAAVRHTAVGGDVLVQRHEPGWIDNVTESVSRRPDLVIEMQDIQHPRDGFMTATMIYDIDGDRFAQPFEAYEVDDDRLHALAAEVNCEVVEILGAHRKWIRLRRRN
ncbi:MAG: hypothetical protein QOI61_1503 [Actinomycetota bacterium]|jgi:SAM-dependent methyltransferase